MVEPASDRQLWEASRDKDTGAFVELVERHQAAVCAVTYALSGNRTDSEELAQETFIVAWKRLETLKDPDRLAAWLCGIARNLARKQLAQRRHGDVSNNPVSDLADARDDPEQAAVNREQEALVWASLAELPLRYREPLGAVPNSFGKTSIIPIR